MDKYDILNLLNKESSKTYTLSNVIKDDYFDRYSIEVSGYGIYEDNINLTKPFNCRYCLIIELLQNKSGNILTTLLMNPSKTYPSNGDNKSRFDQTIRNLIILGYKMGYSQIVVLNSFVTILGNGNKAVEYYKNSYQNSQQDRLNKKFISAILKNKECQDLLAACGDKVHKNLYNYYIDLIKGNNISPWCYAYTKNQRPRHLSLQSAENRKAFNSFLSNFKKIPLKIVK